MSNLVKNIELCLSNDFYRYKDPLDFSYCAKSESFDNQISKKANDW